MTPFPPSPDDNLLHERGEGDCGTCREMEESEEVRACVRRGTGGFRRPKEEGRSEEGAAESRDWRKVRRGVVALLVGEAADGEAGRAVVPAASDVPAAAAAGCGTASVGLSAHTASEVRLKAA